LNRPRGSSGSAQGADAALFYYAGHAIEVAGRNWLIPISATLTDDRSLRFEALELDAVVDQIQGRAKVSILFLDACRDNPFHIQMTGGTRGVTLGLQNVQAPVGMFIAYATAPGTTAADGSGPNSPFTTALLKHIETPGLELRQMITRVRADVRTSTRGRQIPWDTSVLEGDFFFRPTAEQQQATIPQRPEDALAAADLEFWKSVENTKDPTELQAYLNRFPNGIFAELVRERLAHLQVPPAKPDTTKTDTAKTDATKTDTPPVKPDRPASNAAPSPSPPTPSVQSDQSPGNAMEARIAKLMPQATAPFRAGMMKLYGAEKPHRALAAVPGTSHWWRSGGDINEDFASTHALDACQLAFGTPCALVASDDNVASSPLSGPETRDMPRLRGRVPFFPMTIPAFPNSELIKRPEIRDYLASMRPKAIAINALGVYAVTDAPDQPAAEANVLADCNRERKGQNFPCYLYAIRNYVVIGQRFTAPRPPPATIADVVVWYASRLDPRCAAAAPYKAFVLGLSRVVVNCTYSGLADQTLAEQLELERCMILFNQTCVTIGIDDKLKAGDPTIAPLPEVPRATYSGTYKPEMVPLQTRATQDMLDYATMQGPKAMALGTVPPRVAIAAGANDKDAETKVLKTCNDPPDSEWPCILYAVGQQVILPQRRTEPRQ
jgi:hypothetical protein